MISPYMYKTHEDIEYTLKYVSYTLVCQPLNRSERKYWILCKMRMN